MKTLKITEEVHKQLIELQYKLLLKDKVKYTLNEIVDYASMILKDHIEDGNK